jgi:hypothetical protein
MSVIISTDDERRLERLRDLDAVADTVGGPAQPERLKH